jgi:subtilisin family serine protease
MVASAGNRGFDSEAFPSRNIRVVSVGASNINYVPLKVSNWGKGEIELWALGEKVPLCNKNGDEVTEDGTSLAAGYVSGILAILYKVEGTDMNPNLAKARLMAQTDDWITLPNDEGKNWRNSPKALANTGNRKGAAKDPQVAYIGGPKAAAVTTGPTPTTTATTAPTPSLTNICRDKYELFLDHFDIFGKNFNSTVIGTNGLRLKKAISGTIKTRVCLSVFPLT